ncbi:MAG: Serine/threonine protein kinase [Rhodobacteraceae bacterium HLUCCA09]|nr:MAG: Serine/threonine protein kinase [Rhodobacteraceae bacterium HLUCCA09]
MGVRDVFEENGTAYMALDYIDGRDLHDVIEQETWRLDPDTVREIAVQLLDAIGHVHGMGMLHRDISPDNILLTHDDTPILIDFGAARDSAWRKSRVLSTLHVVKDGYSPQEFYLQAGEQSPASDLYSLAASLYRAITGDPPVFSHRRLAAIAERRPDPYVPLEGTADGYDPAFLRMIDTALAVFARDRVQSAADWLAGIELASPPEAADPGAPLPAPTMDDAVIVERVRRLVEATNPEVQALHAERTREREERARCEAEERAAQEAARCRRLEEARREAEEAERAYRERQRQEADARRAVPAPAPEAVPDGEEAVVPPGDAEVPHVPGAGGVNRAKLLKERVERARREREQADTEALSREDGSGGTAGRGRTSRGSLFGLMLGGGWLRPATRDASSKEGFGA